MLEVSRPSPCRCKLQFAKDQIEKYKPGVAHIKLTLAGFVLYRSDMNEPEKKHREYKQSKIYKNKRVISKKGK